MTQLNFLQKILPPLPKPDSFGNGPVYFAIGLDPATGRPDQRPCPSYQSVIDKCNEMSANGNDAYMALASFKEYLQGRKQNNTFEMMSIWADIDCGKPGNVYQNQAEGSVGLVKFVTATGLKPSIVVGSGRGLHCYWCFDKPVASEHWTQIASFFHQLCVQEGLDIDPSRSVEAASVLRLPGTIHQKSGNEVRVLVDNGFVWSPKIFTQHVFSLLRSPQMTHKITVKPAISLAPAIQSQSNNLAALMGMGPKAPEYDADKIARGCVQILSMGIGQYPQWFAAMSVLRRCTNGLEYAHKLSKLDPRYDPNDTEVRFYQAAEDNPCRCSTFESYNPGFCQVCRYKGVVTSPAQLHRIASSLPAPIPTPAPMVGTPIVAAPNSETAALLGHKPELVMPDTWTYQLTPIVSPIFKVEAGKGIVWMRSEKDPTIPGGYRMTEEIICRSQLWYKYSIISVDDMRPKRNHIFEAIHPNGRHEELRLDIDEDLSQMAIMRWFSNGNLHPTSGAYNGTVFMNFMNAYLASVTHNGQELTTYDKFGWAKFQDPVTKNEKMGFVTGAGVITDTGLHNIAYGGKARPWVNKAFSHKGTLENWKRVPEMYKTLNQHVGMLFMCAGLAAPFMPYGAGEAKNSIFNLWSTKSGLGKTQVLRAVASIWGDPYKSFFTKDESIVARARRLTVWNNIPAMMDELTDMPDEQMSNLAFLLINGNEKGKLKSSGAEFVETGDWSTCTFATANKSFKACLAKTHGDTDATLQRVMEYECEFPSFAGVPQVQNYIDETIRLCGENYGLAGPHFIFWLLQQPERLVTLTKHIENWVRQNQFKNDERFMSFPLGLCMKIGRWAVEAGLWTYDMDALEAWVIQDFVKHNRANTKEWAPNFPDMLANYFNDRAMQNTIVVSAEQRPIEQPDPKTPMIPDKYVILRPTRDINMRVAQRENSIYWSKSDFSSWCANRKVSAHNMVKQLRALGYSILDEYISLGRGVSWMPTSRIRCYKIEAPDVAKLGLDIKIT